MNNFVKNFLIIFTLCFGLFVFSGGLKVSEAQVSGCQIESANFRPGGVINNYVDSTPTVIFIDIRTAGCAISDLLKLNLYSIDINGSLIDEQLLQTNLFVVSPISTTSPYSSDVLISSQEEFSIPISLGDEGNIGRCYTNGGHNGSLSSDSPQFQSSLLNQMFESDLSFNPPDCFIYLKIYKNTGSSTPFQLMYELGSGDNPMLIYQCADQDCGMLEDELFVIPSNACFSPNNPQNTNNGLVPYMGSCPLSSSTISVTTINGSNSGGILGSNEYSTEPLAPLPGFTGNPDLGQWLESLFTILIVIAGLLALIMIIVGGITYITSESFGDKGKGKSYIMNAIAGLVLALGAWVILNTINPNLAEDLNIKIPTVSLSIGDADSFSSSESTDSSGTITGNTPLPNIGLVCPMNGGSSSVASIIDSFENKTTYRWGGKGGPLPVGGRFKLSPSEQSGGPQTCTNSDGGQAECRSFCPIDSVCLDCSGFVNQVRRCSGLPTYSGTSSMVNNQDAIPVDMDNLSSDGQSIIINGAQYTLQSGDILVWNGHVVMYYGAGQIAESAGALTTNSNIKKSQLSSYVGKNRITHLIKVNP